MPATDAPLPIALRPAARGLEAASQQSVALALTLMTQFSVDDAAAERATTAASIGSALQALAAAPELTPELRRLCLRLQRIWAAVELQEEPC
jgi:hypothetical protein